MVRKIDGSHVYACIMEYLATQDKGRYLHIFKHKLSFYYVHHSIWQIITYLRAKVEKESPVGRGKTAKAKA